MATGHIVLASDVDPDDAFLARVTLDGRQRLRLPDGLLHRLAVPVGCQVLITAAPDALSLRLLNLGNLADLYAPKPTPPEPAEADD